MDLSTLFGGQGTLNPLALLERIFQQVVDQLARDDSFAGFDDKPPEDLIAAALGKRLARMIVDDQSPSPVRWSDPEAGYGDQPGGPLDDDPAYDDELADRNLTLAAALGACDCWGQDDGCPVCEGVGGPGWLPPDRQLFAAYVYPAMRAIGRAGGSPGGPSGPNGHARSNHQREESSYVRHDGR